MKPILAANPSTEQLEAITETKNGLKVIGKATQKFAGQIGATVFFLEDGSDVMEDDNGNVLEVWPEYVPPAPEPVVEEGQADE